MRLRLSLVFLCITFFCAFALAQSAPAPTQPDASALLHNPAVGLVHPDGTRADSQEVIDKLTNDAQRPQFPPRDFSLTARRLTPEQRDQLKRFQMESNGGLGISPNTCLKLRKYIFRRQDGSDATRFVGTTDCTYTRRIHPKSADKPDSKRPTFGLQSAVAH